MHRQTWMSHMGRRNTSRGSGMHKIILYLLYFRFRFVKSDHLFLIPLTVCQLYGSPVSFSCVASTIINILNY